MNLIKPKLVDHSLIKYPKKKPTIIQKKIVKQDNGKFYLNLFMVMILAIGGYALYYRMQNKEKEQIELETNILLLDKYVTDSLSVKEEKK
jgi:hypothetical protein